MQNYFKYMMLTYLSKELHSFLNISVLFRKLFTYTYPIQFIYSYIFYTFHRTWVSLGYFEPITTTQQGFLTNKVRCNFFRIHNGYLSV